MPAICANVNKGASQIDITLGSRPTIQLSSGSDGR